MRVAVHYHASDEGARETARLIHEAGGDAITLCADLSNPRGPEQLIEQTIEQLGALDVLVN
jgi:NAD(P)-dependent dehydrogenase (short-subunit alcohol dehydrogenase family)